MRDANIDAVRKAHIGRHTDQVSHITVFYSSTISPNSSSQLRNDSNVIMLIQQQPTRATTY